MLSPGTHKAFMPALARYSCVSSAAIRLKPSLRNLEAILMQSYLSLSPAAINTLPPVGMDRPEAIKALNSAWW